MKYLLLIFASLFLSCNDESTNPIESENEFNTTGLEIPLIDNQDVIIEYTNYSVSYVEEHELSEWVAYELTKEELIQNYDRTDDFRPDPNVTTGTAESSDYVGSGYDRGHLMPAADCVWDATAMTESFYFTNIAPQVSGLNRGEWSELEERFRELARTYNKVWITTGCLFDSIIETIGENEVSVPYEYYKAGLYQDNGNFYTVAFILPNTPIDNELSFSDFQVTIDELEERTGFDLYHKLQDGIETEIEGAIISNPIFSNSYLKRDLKQNTDAASEVKKATNTRCQGMTKKGKQCKRTVKNGKYCWQHK